MLDVIPGKYAMSERIADRIAGKLLGIFADALALLPGLKLLIRFGRSSGEVV